MQDDSQVAKELFNLLKEDTSEVQQDTDALVVKSGKDFLSKSSFEEMGFSPDLLKAIYNANFDKPSLIQQGAIPTILKGGDIVVQAKSGSGKTVAFILGILGNIKEGNAVIIAPSRELAIQIGEVFQKMTLGLPYKAYLALKNKPFSYEGECVIIGTPGSLISTLSKVDVTKIRIAVLDEADNLLHKDQMGIQTSRILKILQNTQKAYFSATYSSSTKEIIGEYSPKANEMYEEKNGKPEEIKLFYLEVGRMEKTECLFRLFEYLTVAQMIVFVSSKVMAGKLKDAMEKDAHSVSVIHGDMTTEERDQASANFKNAGSKILIATDVFSRGMDIPQVNLIVNYDMPHKCLSETYIHRIGRSGRFGRRGFVVDFIASSEDLQGYLRIQEEIGCPSKKFTISALEKVFNE